VSLVSNLKIPCGRPVITHRRRSRRPLMKLKVPAVLTSTDPLPPKATMSSWGDRPERKSQRGESGPVQAAGLHRSGPRATTKAAANEPGHYIGWRQRVRPPLALLTSARSSDPRQERAGRLGLRRSAVKGRYACRSALALRIPAYRSLSASVQNHHITTQWRNRLGPRRSALTLHLRLPAGLARKLAE